MISGKTFLESFTVFSLYFVYPDAVGICVFYERFLAYAYKAEFVGINYFNCGENIISAHLLKFTCVYIDFDLGILSAVNVKSVAKFGSVNKASVAPVVKVTLDTVVRGKFFFDYLSEIMLVG